MVGCKSEKPTEAVDLMKYGMPIKIKAPAEAEIKSDDLGFMKDVTVKAGESYSLQITSSEAILTDASEIASKLLKEVKRDAYFDSVVTEEPNGFVYKKDIDGKEDYDFRHVRIAGSSEYIFQTALVGTFSLEDVKAMYESVK
jgi:hypothetical protein